MEECVVALIYKNDLVYDRAYTFEAAESYANIGYKVKAINDYDSYWTVEKMQRVLDSSLAAYKDCFGIY